MNCYARLSAAGASALSLWRLQLDAELQLELFGRELEVGKIERVQFSAGARHDHAIVDDALASKCVDGAIEVSLHGGMGVAQAWQERLQELGCVAQTKLNDAGSSSGWREIVHARSPLAARIAWASRDYETEWLSAQRGGAQRAQAFAAARMKYKALCEHLSVPPRLALLGPANAGKSSLFNALVRQDRVTVSPHPGTTRDAVEASVLLGSGPDALEWTWVDTAGLWDDARGVDRLAVAQSRQEAQAAWGRIWVFDQTLAVPPNLNEWLKSAADHDVLLWNHSDRGDPVGDAGLAESWSGPILRGSVTSGAPALVAQLESAWVASLPPVPPVGLSLPRNSGQWNELAAAAVVRHG